MYSWRRINSRSIQSDRAVSDEAPAGREQTEEFLPVVISGTVVKGEGRGRGLGFPTANIAPHGGALPALPHGVYAGWTRLDTRRYPSVVSFGRAETFGDQMTRLEVHLIGYTSDLYNRELTVELVEYLRPMEQFPSVRELKAAMEQDRIKALETLQNSKCKTQNEKQQPKS